MKRTLLSLSIALLCFFSNAQRSLDLHLTLITPQDESTLLIDQAYPFSVSVTNTDPDTNLEYADSVYYYVIIMSDTMMIYPDSTNHWSYGGNFLEPTESFNINRWFGFSDTYLDMYVDICIFIKPMNPANPVEDPNLANNTECITIHIVESDLSVHDQQLAGVKLAPNPASSQFSLVGLPENASVSVTDLNGKSVQVIPKSESVIDCSTWPNGVYLVNISTAEGAFVDRIVVSH